MKVYLAAAAALLCGVLASGQQGTGKAGASRPGSAPAASKPTEAKLEFRLAALRSGREGKPLLDEAKARAYIQRLAERGPEQASDAAFAWFGLGQHEPLQPAPAWTAALPAQLVSGKHKDRPYVLLANAPDQALTIDAKHPYLSSVFPARGQDSRPAIGFRLTAQGAAALGRMMQGSRGSYLAIVVNSEVYAPPAMHGAVYDSGVIEGDFKEGQIAEVIKSLAPAISASQSRPAK